MAPRGGDQFVVQFVGDLGNLNAFTEQVSGKLSATAAIIQRNNAAVFEKAFGPFQSPTDAGPSRYLQNQVTTIDTFLNTVKQRATLVQRYLTDYRAAKNILGDYEVQPVYSTFSKQIENVAGDIRKLGPYLSQLEAINLRISKIKATAEAQRSNLGAGNLTEFPGLQNLVSNSATQIAQIEAQLSAVGGPENRAANTREIISRTSGVVKTQAQARLVQIQAEIDAARAQIAQITQQGEAAILSASNKIQTSADRRISSIISKNRALIQTVDGLLAQAPPLEPRLQSVLTQSPDLAKMLQRQGLAGGLPFNPDNENFRRAIQTQSAQITGVTQNLKTGVTTVRGEFDKLSRSGELVKGFSQNFFVEMDKGGKVLTRFGGALSGVNSFVTQTISYFQRFIEWTIAATAVLGTLGLVVKSLSTINDLNNNLTRLSITSQLSAKDTRDLFDSLSKVAIQTATPLTEIIKSADDVALAVRKPGQSVQELKNDIIGLTTAVGIFTNLTGTDTVRATDLLTSAYKQLELAPKDLPLLLSKITAAAGGQSTAINDITQAVGTVATAAKAARLSVDQIVGAVQVLSQVTAKSPADVATAFKNLFGAINAPASVKVLKQFGINVRDAAGDLRPFLTIYNEIAAAINKGIIPAGRVQDVLRAISGGPRRAPDAAALLENINKVNEATGRAANASNEALIANAKILDTNSAKIVQFQNAFDIAIFKQFGESVKQATAALTELGGVLLNAFAGIDPHIIAIVLQIGALIAGVKLASSALKLIFGPAIAATIGSLKDLDNAQKLAAIGVVNLKQKVAEGSLTVPGATLRTFNYKSGPQSKFVDDETKKIISDQEARARAATTIPALPLGYQTGGQRLQQGLIGLTRTPSGIGKIGAGIGLAAAAAVGVVDQDARGTISNLLQIGGTIGLVTGFLTPLSIAAIAAGTALQIFSGDGSKAADSAKQLQSDIYTLTQNYKNAAQDAQIASKTQSEVGTQLDSLAKKTHRSADEELRLTDLRGQFADATLELADANLKMAISFDALIEKIPKLGNEYGTWISAAKSGLLDLKSIQELSYKLAGQILVASNTGFVLPKDIVQPPSARNAPNAPQYGSGQFQIQVPTAQHPEGNLQPASQSLKDYLETVRNSGDAKQALSTLFTTGADGAIKFSATLDGSNQSLLEVQALLLDLKNTSKLSTEDYVRYAQAFQTYGSSVSKAFATAQTLATRGALLQSLQGLGALSGDALGAAQNLYTLAQSLQNLQNTAPKETVYDLEGLKTERPVVPVEQTQALLQKLLYDEKGQIRTTPISFKEAVEYGTAVLKLSGALDDLRKHGGDVEVFIGIAKIFHAAGIEVSGLTDKFKAQIEESERLKQSTTQLNEVIKTARGDFAQRQLSLLSQQNSGDFAKNAAGLAALQKQSKELYRETVRLGRAFTDAFKDEDQFKKLQGDLSHVIGFEDAANLSAQELAIRFEQAAIAAGLSGKQVDIFATKLVNLVKISSLINQAKAVLGITVNIDTAEAVKKLRALVATLTIFSDIFSHTIVGKLFGNPFAGQIKAVQDLANQLSKVPNTSQKDLEADLNKLLHQGSGTKLGVAPTPKPKPSYNVSLLDLPEEITKAPNEQSLIQQAIKNAIALRNKIPGETKKDKFDIVELLDGTKKVAEVRGVSEELLRKALQELTDIEKKRLDFETKADTIRRIRVGAGDFSAIANVPLNSKTGVSLGGPQGPINVSLNVNGQILTPAQLAQFAELVASALKSQIARSG